MVNGLCGPSLFRCFVLVSLVHQTYSANDSSHDKDSESVDETENGLTCYTCVNVSDNLMCNQFAIDRPCPKGENFCHTLHIMDSTGASVVVNKKCTDRRECWPLGVGCVLIDTQTVCVSCCDEMYCNVTVPTNKSTATFSNKRTQNRQRGSATRYDNSCPANTQSNKHTSLIQVATIIIVLSKINVL